MKRITAIILSAVIVFTVMSLTACGEYLSGTYVNTALETETSYYFRGDKVTLTVTANLLGNVVSKAYEGEYEITETDGGSRFIEFDFDSEKAKLYEGAKTFSENEKDGTLTIGGIEYKSKK